MVSRRSVVNMKKTFDLPESLTHELQELARKRATTIDDLATEALWHLIEEERTVPRFRLEVVSVNGWNSRTPEARGLSVSELVRRSNPG